MNDKKSSIPASLSRILTRTRPEKNAAKFEKPGLLTNGKLFEAPKGYKSVGKVIVENYMLVEDTVPEDVHQRAGLSDDVIIKLRSETIVEDGQLKGDRIEAEYFVREFLCC